MAVNTYQGSGRKNAVQPTDSIKITTPRNFRIQLHCCRALKIYIEVERFSLERTNFYLY